MNILLPVLAYLTGCLSRRISDVVSRRVSFDNSVQNLSRSLSTVNSEASPDSFRSLSKVLFARYPSVGVRPRTPVSRASQARLDASSTQAGAIRRRADVMAFVDGVDTMPTVAPQGVVVPANNADFKQAMAAAKRCIDDILVREPDWKYFSPDVVLKDAAGNKLSAHYIKSLLRALRKFNKKFVSRGYVRVGTSTSGSTEMITRGSLDLQGFGLPIPVPFGAFKVHVEGTATIRFNSDAKITEIEIGDWKINGKKCDLPRLTGSDPSELSWQDKASLLAWAARTITC